MITTTTSMITCTPSKKRANTLYREHKKGEPNMTKCCLNCKHCFEDPSVDDIECGLPDEKLNDAEWISQESEAYYSPSHDYCTEWEERRT